MIATQQAVSTGGVVSRLWKWTLVGGLLTVILGIVVLSWPGPSILTASILFGAYLLVSGVADVIAAFALHRPAVERVMRFVSGALSVTLAILAFRHFGDGYAVLLLSVWIGVGFVFQGVSATVVAIGASELPGRGWYIASGVASAIAGLIVLAWPFDSIVVLTLVVGFWLVVIGVIEVVHALQIRKDASDASDVVHALTHPVAA